MALPGPASPGEDLGSMLRITTVLMTSLTGIFMGFRLFMGVVRLRFGWEDALLCFGWACFLGMCTADALATKYEFGKPYAAIAPENLSNMKLFSGLIASITWSFAVTSVKASFAVLYMRFLAHAGRKWVVPLNKGILIFLACQAIEEVTVVTFQCVPIDSQWRTDIEGTCYALVPMWLCDFAFNLATDLILFLQPIPAIWSLRFISTAKKIGIITMLSLGLTVCIISVVRLFAVLRLIRGNYSPYDAAIAVIWCQVEVGTLIICSCVPHLHQAVLRIEPLCKLFNMQHKNQQNVGQGTADTKTFKEWTWRICSLGCQGGRSRGAGEGVVVDVERADDSQEESGQTVATQASFFEGKGSFGSILSCCRSMIFSFTSVWGGPGGNEERNSNAYTRPSIMAGLEATGQTPTSARRTGMATVPEAV